MNIRSLFFLLSSLGFFFAVDAATIKFAPPADGEATDLVALRDEVRKLRSALPAGETVEVVFAPGVYNVTNTVVLYRADSHIVWRAEERGKVRFRSSSRIPVSSFTKKKMNGVSVRVADVSAILPGELAPWAKDFRAPPSPWLYRNGMPMTIARWPNAGEWMTFSNAVVSAGDLADGGSGEKKPDSIVCDDERAKTWDFSKGVWFYGYWCHDWSESFIQGGGYDPETKVIKLIGKHGYGIGGRTWGFKSRRYFALNILSELDEPGEWYLDRENKKLYVVPSKDEVDAKYDLATGEMAFIKSDGLTDAVFYGFVFEYSHAGTAVNLAHCDDVKISDCTFGNLGGNALQITGKNTLVEYCRFGNIGKACIIIAGGERKTLEKSGIVVNKCQFRRWARFVRTYNPAVLLRGCGTTVKNSVFREAPHNAILFGGNDHLIEGNEFDRILTETGDAGAIYTGRNPSEMGTMIRGNWFHDLGDEKNRDYTSAVYFDDCDWGDSVISNKFERLGRGILLGGGNIFDIEGNTFSECKIGIHIDSRGMTWKNYKENPDWFKNSFKDFVPFNDEWLRAYPKVVETLNDTPSAPWNNRLVGNTFTNCIRNTQFDKGVLSVTNRMEIVNSL